MSSEIILDLATGTTTERPLTPTAPMVPEVVSRAQAKLALLAQGLLDDADAAISAAGPSAHIEWADRTEFRRDHPLIASIGEALGLSDEQIDDLFRAAGAL